MLQHPYFICHCKGEGTATSAFSDHNGKYRNCKTCQCVEIFCNGFSLSAFFCFQTAECTRRIHKADHRSVKLLRLLHQTQGFPVTFRGNHSEIPGNVFLCSFTFFLSENCHRLSMEKRHTADHCRVIAAVTVSVKFHKIIKDCFDVVFSCGSCFAPGKLDMFPGGVIS